jgi:hypothetical protein
MADCVVRNSYFCMTLLAIDGYKLKFEQANPPCTSFPASLNENHFYPIDIGLWPSVIQLCGVYAHAVRRTADY